MTKKLCNIPFLVDTIWNMLLNVFKTVIIVISTLLGRLLPVPFLICTSDKQTRLTFRLNYKMLQAWNYSVVFTSMVCTKLSLQPLLTTVCVHSLCTPRGVGYCRHKPLGHFCQRITSRPCILFWNIRVLGNILSLCYAQRPFGWSPVPCTCTVYHRAE